MQYDVPSQDGKTLFITGANTGIGRVTALELARAGARVILAGRSRERTQPVIDEITSLVGEDAVAFLELDLGDLDSVRHCAEAFEAMDESLDGLINNAGVVSKRGLTRQGFEMAFGVNHLGHFALTMQLWEHLKHEARIVHVSSRAHERVEGIDFTALQREARTRTAVPEYSVSKLANVLFSNELARRCEGTGIHSYALHPGVIASDLWRGVPRPVRWLMTRFMISNEEGAMTTLYCATSPQLSDHNGLYYDACKTKIPTSTARDPQLAAQLWERSVAWSEVNVPDVLQGYAD